MPICEIDPWRMQYFEGIPCPPEVRIPTEDSDAWEWYPAHRWVYDKVQVALSQGLDAAPHGVDPPAFPIFSKPLINLRGMGVASRVIASADEYQEAITPGHMWMTLLQGEHLSTDVALEDGEPRWWRHSAGAPAPGGTFEHWHVMAAPRPEIEASCGAWARRHLRGYTGLLNLETIGGRIIEAHLRLIDQWPDLYGQGWVEAAIALYAGQGWHFDDGHRRDAYSVPLFAPHATYRHPPASVVAAAQSIPGVSSVQITFHEDRAATRHAMPPGGFRLAIVNGWNLTATRRARAMLKDAFGVMPQPSDASAGSCPN